MADSFLIMSDAFNKMRAEQPDTSYTNYSWIEYKGTPLSGRGITALDRNSTAITDPTIGDGGYTAPVRRYVPLVYKQGQTGVKTLIHFDELSINAEGKPYPKDETKREWYWKYAYYPEYGVLGSPAKFGAFGFPGNTSILCSPASEDFNFGNGDFCVAGWMVLPSAGIGNGNIWSFPNTPYMMIWQFDSRPNYRDECDGLFAVIKGHSDEISTVGGSLFWRFGCYDYDVDWDDYIWTYYEVGEEGNLSPALFDDAYHYFAFARSGNIFSVYVDRVRIASTEVYANATLYYDESWQFYYCWKSFSPS